MNKNIAILSLTILLLHQTAGGQHINFKQLNASLGLSDNNVKAVTTDQTGFIWIGTGNGLNLYDGNRITHFKKEKYPELCSDDISSLLCDPGNRIWIGSSDGITMLDEQRRFHRIVLHDTLKSVSVKSIIYHPAYGVILLTDKGFFSSDEKSRAWRMMEFSKPLINETFTDVSFFSQDTIMICSDFMLFTIIDLKKQSIIYRNKINAVTAACRLNDSLVFMGFTLGKMQLWNIRSKRAEKEFTTGNIGNKSSSSINDVLTAADGSIIISSGYSGIYIFNPHSRQFSQYLHEAYNPFSPAANNTDEFFSEENGNVFITTSETGLMWFNVKNYSPVNIPVFKTAAGKLFDNYITHFAKDKKNNFWLAAFDHLIEWNPESDTSRFFYYPYMVKAVGIRNIEIKTVCIDGFGKIWAGSRGAGIGILDEVTGKFSIYNNLFQGKDSGSRRNYVTYMLPTSDNWIWVGTYDGLYRINPANLQTDLLKNHPCNQLQGKRINIIYEDRSRRLWFGTNKNGAWCWDPSSGKLKNYTSTKQLLSDNCLSFLEYKNGDMFIGTSKGISVLKSDSAVMNITTANGLRSDWCQGMLEDNQGNIWISNGNCIICYQPGRQTFRYFDEKSGLATYGFLSNGYFKDMDGTLYWGSNKGISYFDPHLLLGLNTNPSPAVYKLTIADSVYLLTSNKPLKFSYRENNISFHFASVNLPVSSNILYQYKLEGADNKWNTARDQSEVSYNSLPPGKYSFLLKASADGINWIDSPRSVSIIILKPFWKTTGFITGCFLLAGTFIFWLVRRRIKTIRHEAEMKQKIAETEMMALRAQMNPHFIFNCLNSIDDLIQNNEKEKATAYLAKFAKLIRAILENSKSNSIPCWKDLEALKLYLELEEFRWDNKFSYQLKIAPEIMQGDYKVPPMIIQPYVENAIHHGLLNKDQGTKELVIAVTTEKNHIIYTVEDNGIGRKKAMEYKQFSKPGHQSMGLDITRDRISLFNQNNNGNVTITDLFDENKVAVGTKVKVTLINQS